jgi:hypothetical protein
VPFGVWLPVVVGVDAPSEVAVDSAKDLFEGAFWVPLLSPGVVGMVVLAALASGGTPAPVLEPSADASVLGFAFLRGFIRAAREKGSRRRNGRYLCYQHMHNM